jgi:hypothetical protein
VRRIVPIVNVILTGFRSMGGRLHVCEGVCHEIWRFFGEEMGSFVIEVGFFALNHKRSRCHIVPIADM